jgi:6-phosphogluconolactonase
VPRRQRPPRRRSPDEKPAVWAADLRFTPNGKFLYTTERNTDKIALFTVAPGTGKLTYVANFATERQPRGINIDPSGHYLVASGARNQIGSRSTRSIKRAESSANRRAIR